MPEFELPPAPRFRVFREVIFRWEHRDKEGNLKGSGEHSIDLVPNAGLDWISSQVAGTVSGTGTTIALGTGTTTPTMGDLTLAGEITGSGLTRVVGSTSGVGALVGLASGGDTSQATGSFYVFYTFTASGVVTVNEAGVSINTTFNAGVVTHDLLSPAASMAVGDTLLPSFQFIL